MSDSESDSTVVTGSIIPEQTRPSRSKSLLFSIYRFPVHLSLVALRYVYLVYQSILAHIFSGEYQPLPESEKFLGRIAIIGAGLTGISSAAHAVDHGFDVVIYEAEESVGGVWARENSTSQLQLNSFLYRFHPTVRWTKGSTLR